MLRCQLRRRISRRLGDLPRREDGTVSILAIFLILMSILISGMAIEFGNIEATRAHIQAVADSAAHAALYTRDEGTPDEAKAAALSIAAHMAPENRFGDVVKIEDVIFGKYDEETGVFTPSPLSKSAVRVIARREDRSGNPLPSLIYRMLGYEYFNLSVDAIYVTWEPPCLREGLVGEDVVDLQSNNGFFNGFCVHSNRWVEVNQNNTFEPGTIVQMPDKDDLVIPNSGFEKNEGLLQALREGQYNLRLLNRFADIYDSLSNADSPYTPDYITAAVPNKVPYKQKLTPADLQKEAVNVITCNGGKRLTLDGVFEKVGILTNCRVQLTQSTRLEDTLLFTTNTDDRSINAPSGFQIGRNDNCAPGGGAQVITMGGVKVAANLSMYNGQIVAAKDVDFAARANGVMGASIVSGGRIDGTSNTMMGFCGTGMEDNLFVNYFRLAK